MLGSLPKGWNQALVKTSMKYWDGEYHPLNLGHQILTSSEDILQLLPSNLVFACVMSGHCFIPFIAMPYLFV